MTTPRGWYDDGHGAMRWWDGAEWTEQVADATVDGSAGRSPGRMTADHPGVAGEPRSAATAQAEPTKSRMWIVWVALGVVVVGIVIVAALLIPQLLGGAAAQSEGAGSATLTDQEQQAAIATIELHDDAWQNADCDAYVASTTENFRTQAGLNDCSSFESEAEAFSAAVEEYEIAVTDVREENGQMLVTTTETYTTLLGEAGEPLDEPNEESIEWVYALVPDGDDWVIDGLK